MRERQGHPMLSDDFFLRVQDLREQPKFRLHIAYYCFRSVEPAEITWPTHKMLNQAGRYLISFLLIHNDYAQRHGGAPRPTLTALQAMVGSSARQTASFVAALKAARLIWVEAQSGDARVKCLRASPRLVAEIGRSGRLFVAAMDALADRRPALAPALEHPDRLGLLIFRSAAHILQHGMLTEPFPRILRLTGRDCGYPLLTAIAGAYYAATVPGAPAALPLSLRALADRLRVSRAHIGNLLQEADAAGWFRTDGPHLTQFDPTLLDEFEYWAGCQMIFYDDLAAAICAEAACDTARLP